MKCAAGAESQELMDDQTTLTVELKSSGIKQMDHDCSAFGTALFKQDPTRRTTDNC